MSLSVKCSNFGVMARMALPCSSMSGIELAFTRPPALRMIRDPRQSVPVIQVRHVVGATTSIDHIAQEVLTFCSSPSVSRRKVIIEGGIHLY